MSSITSPTSVVLRPPTVVAEASPSAYQAPSLSFLQGTWHVTHSTLPMWKSKRDVSITYDLLPPSSPSISPEQTDRLDDVVSYKSLNSDKVQTVRGIDKASGESRDTWDWRGKGWLMIASSHWEVLGWGEEEASGGEWAVTYFAKTLFTPAGIDIYSRARAGLQEETVQRIKQAFESMENAELKALAKDIFKIL